MQAGENPGSQLIYAPLGSILNWTMEDGMKKHDDQFIDMTRNQPALLGKLMIEAASEIGLNALSDNLTENQIERIAIRAEDNYIASLNMVDPINEIGGK